MATTIQEIVETGNLQRSGNPGYQKSKPLIVSTGDTSDGSKIVNYGGFYLKGPGIDGECLKSDSTQEAGLSERIDYGSSITLGCTIKIDSLNEFQEFCEDTTTRLEYLIFSQI